MEYTDQLGRTFELSTPPKRILSLVPSQTELLIDLGLKEYVVGLTKFCVHPEGLIKEKTVVGGTKQLHVDRVKALQPDIILCNKEENTEQIVQDMEVIAPVHVSDIKTIDDALSLIEMYGEIFQIESKASALVKDIQQRYHTFLKERKVETPSKRVGYFIWRNPWMVAGQDTFIDYLLDVCGFENAYKILEGRYPEVSLEQLKDLDYIFLSSEPFPFVEKHIKELIPHTNAKIVLVDGEYFSWYGSRLLGAFDYFSGLIKQLEL